MPGILLLPSTTAAPRDESRRPFQITFTEEQMQRYRAAAEEARRTTLIGHIATDLPEYEVLQERVTATFPEARRDCSPCILRNGWFEVMFTSSDAKDQALAGSPYDLAGTHWITFSPWRQSPDT